MRLSRADGPALAAIAAGAVLSFALSDRVSFDFEYEHPGEHVVVHEHLVVHEDGASEGNAPASDGEPLIYLDGVPVDGTLSDLALDPAGIDRIEVIKGAAASKQYGEAGANGVVQIFTKRDPAEATPRGPGS